MDNFQSEFERRRGHLTDPYVRDLAWILDSPDLLDPAAPQWQGKIATLFDHQGQDIDDWLNELECDPQELRALIESHGFARLGRYSELLIAFFLRKRNLLHAHGLQVRAGKNETLGEFDFLLYRTVNGNPPVLLHWEFATKFYLLEANGNGRDADFLVGPNLADTLGAKMRKILDRQLSLSNHPAAQALLPQPVDSARALVKGWLFYSPTDGPTNSEMTSNGVSASHCRGYWSAMADLDALSGEYFRILPRLSWMAPARAPIESCMNKYALADALIKHFEIDTLPVMVATMAQKGDAAIEVERGFIVPNDWRNRARAFVERP